MASSRNPLDWFQYQVGMQSFRAFAEGRATWILNYSWDGDKKVSPRPSMMNLAMSQLTTGANFWDASGHVMSGSNDPATRAEIFRWIGEHEKTFYHPRKPMNPVGVYFSPATRNSFPEDFVRSYQGILILLMQKHVEFQIVTPRTLANFHGETLVLPDVRFLDSVELDLLRKMIGGGRKVVLTGRAAFPLPESPQVVRFPECPGKHYLAALEKDYAATTPDQQSAFLASLQSTPQVSVEASPALATHIASVDGMPHIFFANFKGLRGGANPEPTPENNARVIITGKGPKKAYFLPFMGEVTTLTGKQQGTRTIYQLPAIQRGAVVWIEKK